MRIIAATNRSLKDGVKAGRFREDLYYRLDVFPIECAPLRERLDDIPHLAQHLLDGVIKKLNIAKIRLTNADIDRLKRYDRPGNVLSAATGARLPAAMTLMTEHDRKRRDRENVLAALDMAKGKVFAAGGAAELLKIPPTTLLSRMKSLGIKV